MKMVDARVIDWGIQKRHRPRFRYFFQLWIFSIHPWKKGEEDDNPLECLPWSIFPPSASTQSFSFLLLLHTLGLSLRSLSTESGGAGGRGKEDGGTTEKAVAPFRSFPPRPFLASLSPPTQAGAHLNKRAQGSSQIERRVEEGGGG